MVHRSNKHAGIFSRAAASIGSRAADLTLR
jgi:hypothetical protein